jgi:hypothetical protein
MIARPYFQEIQQNHANQSHKEIPETERKELDIFTMKQHAIVIKFKFK